MNDSHSEKVNQAYEEAERLRIQDAAAAHAPDAKAVGMRWKAFLAKSVAQFQQQDELKTPLPETASNSSVEGHAANGLVPEGTVASGDSSSVNRAQPQAEVAGVIPACHDSGNQAPPVAGFGQWISVKERLPEEKQNVLIAAPNLIEPALGYIINPYNEWITLNTTWASGIHKITHWMPLPLPPTEGKG